MPKTVDVDHNAHYAAIREALMAEGYDAVRAKWKNGIRDVKAYDRFLAETALENFAKHGNTSLLNDRLNDLRTDGRNYTRPAAFIKWAITHQPLLFKLEQSKFEKNRDSSITKEEYDVLLVEAMTIPYWEFAPDMELQQFAAADVVTALESVLKKFKGKKFSPKDDVASNELAQAEIKVAELRRLVPLEQLVAATVAAKVEGVSQPATETVAEPLIAQKMSAAA